jgi:hypothetical protein
VSPRVRTSSVKGYDFYSGKSLSAFLPGEAYVLYPAKSLIGKSGAKKVEKKEQVRYREEKPKLGLNFEEEVRHQLLMSLLRYRHRL